ncbi:response regulator [Qipengyuania sp. 483]
MRLWRNGKIPSSFTVWKRLFTNIFKDDSNIEKSFMILVVEDEADVREELIEMLELRGFAVCGAASVASALDTVREATTPLILLTDLRLREGSGLSLIRQIDSDPALRPKVARSILMTGHIDLTEKAQGDVGKQDIPILFKPVDFKVLLPLLAEGV